MSLAPTMNVVIFTVQLLNTGTNPIPTLNLRIPIPCDTQYQRIEAVTIVPRPVSRKEIPGGGKVAFLRYRHVGPGESRWAFVAVRFEPLEFEPRKGLLTRRLKPEVRKRCLGSSYKLDPNSDPVQQRAKRLAADKTDPYDIVRAFVADICENFEYELDDRQDDVDTILAAGKGSCSELSRVFVAMCRARGIPTRFASGTRLRSRHSPCYVDTVHHRWVEVFLPKYGWFPVDISMAVSRADPERRFGQIPARRLTFLRNAGLSNDALYSSGLTLVEPRTGVLRRLRSYWYRRSSRTIGRALRLVKEVRRDAEKNVTIRDRLLLLKGIHAIPFQAATLYEPLAQGDPSKAIDVLAAANCPAAVVPLADYASGCSHVPVKVADALETLTGQRFETGEEWQAWLRGDGLAFLRK